MFDRAKLIALHLEALAELGWTPPMAGDAIDQAACGALLDSEDAGFVGGRGASTVARWAQAAEDEGAPIAIKGGTSWLFVTSRLLDFIERKFGLPARREAETRHRKLTEMRARSQNSQNSTSHASPRAASVPETWDNRGSKIALDPDHPIQVRAVGME
jgi:hypothetical protein